MTMQADLGLGHFEVIIRATRPNGSVDELHVYKMAVTEPLEHGVTFDLKHETDDFIGRHMIRKQLLDPAVLTATITVCGVLCRVDDPDNDKLYTMAHHDPKDTP